MTYLKLILMTDDLMQNAGFIDTIVSAEQKIADQGDRLWKKMPGVRQDGNRKCQICLQVSFLNLFSSNRCWL